MSMLLERVRASYRPTRPEDFRSIQMNVLLEDVVALIATYMRHREITLKLVRDPALPMITGIPDQLQQVALNLLMNAAEAMPSGGHITIYTRSLPGQEKILFLVVDTGLGIAPELLPHIFEPFVTGKETGTGLGLSISDDIISQHGGAIQAENNPLGGATFKVFLPLRPKDSSGMS
jgi:signal transduction histidine kinase